MKTEHSKCQYTAWLHQSVTEKVRRMSITIIKKTVFLSILVSSIFSYLPSSFANETSLQQLAESATRSDASRQRNQYRHPAETLSFFGLTPQMSVLEIWPAHGWYTEILAPYLKKDGKLTLAHFPHNDGSLKDERSVFWAKVSQRLQQRIADNSDFFGVPKNISKPSGCGPLSAANSAVAGSLPVVSKVFSGVVLGSKVSMPVANVSSYISLGVA